MGIDQSLKASLGKPRHHAYMNRRRTAVETLKRAIFQFQEARALLGDSDLEEPARKQLDDIIRSMTQAISSDLPNSDAIPDAPAVLVSRQVA